jgi:hypothetical protein
MGLAAEPTTGGVTNVVLGPVLGLLKAVTEYMPNGVKSDVAAPAPTGSVPVVLEPS